MTVINLIPDYLLFIAGLAILIGSADLLVRNATKAASAMGRSLLFVGLTITAFGTSAPELAIGITGVVGNKADIGLGNIVGSNIFNILFVIGLAALIRPIIITSRTIQRDIPIVLLTGILFFVLVLDGGIGVIDAVVLLFVLIGYLVYISRVSSEKNPLSKSGNTTAQDIHFSGRKMVGVLALIALSIVLLIIASRMMVTSAVSIAAGLGMTDFTIGLTIVAVGTSLPEIATSVTAVRKGEFELAVGNVMGSCLFNIVVVPSTMALLKAGQLSFATEAIHWDLPIMIAVVVVCLPIFFSGHLVSRKEGALFLGYYALYGATLFYRKTTEPNLGEYKTGLLLLVGGMLLITLIIVTVRAITYRPDQSIRK